jgi:matrixin
VTSPVLLVADLLLGQVDAGYVRSRTSDGAHCLRWPVTGPSRGNVPFAQSASGDPDVGSGAFDAVSRARQTWEAQMQVCGSLDLVESGQSSSRNIGYSPGGSNENLILFRTRDCRDVVPASDPCHSNHTCDNAYDCWDNAAGALAVTTTTYTVADGALLDADIEVNGATAHPTIVDAPPCSGMISQLCVANDVQNTLTHELGHALGLDHSPDPASTMYAQSAIGETSKRILDPGTKQFVCDVYPAGRSSLDCAPDAGDGGGTGGTGGPAGGGPSGPGVARSSSGCGSMTGGGASVLLALCLLALPTRRRGGRPSGGTGR